MSFQSVAFLPNGELYTRICFGSKEKFNIRFHDKYDYAIYYEEGKEIPVPNQQFYRIINSKGIVLIFGIPVYGYKLIRDNVFDWLAGTEFDLNAATVNCITGKYVSDYHSLVYSLFADSNTISKCSWSNVVTTNTTILVTANTTTPLSVVETVNTTTPLSVVETANTSTPLSVVETANTTTPIANTTTLCDLSGVETTKNNCKTTKPTWQVIPANTYTQIPSNLHTIKILPNGKKITFRINENLYEKYTDYLLQIIKKIQNKPYATLTLSTENKSVFIMSAEDLYYKPTAKTQTNFCFRDCGIDNGRSFYASNAINIYSETEGVLEYDNTKVKGEPQTIPRLYMYVYKILNQGPHQTKFKFVKESNWADDDKFFVEYKL